MKKTIVLLLLFSMNLFVLKAQQIGNGWAPVVPDFGAILQSGVYSGENITTSIDQSHSWQHLFVIRHPNSNNNHQFQMTSSYAENDRVFFRKIATGLNPRSTDWIEFATRGTNTFNGNQNITGNLGIGNANPQAKLTINVEPTNSQSRGLQIRSNESLFAELIATGSTYNGWGVGPNEIWLNSQAGNLTIGPATNHNIKFVANGSEKMRITSQGAILNGDNIQPYMVTWAMGTTVIGKNGTDKVIIGYLGEGSGTNGAVVGGHNSALNGWSNLNLSGSNLIFRTNGETESMRITSGGNLGIGTPAPAFKLDIADAHTIRQTSNVNYAQFNMKNANGSSWLVAYEKSLRFYAGQETANPDVTIAFGGNVGIGTISPQSKLAVNGDVFAKKVKVTQSGWPDYVFNKEYELMPLTDVEAFILKYKHLPEVPSAAEIEKNDLDLGEMNRLLLMKVEELTLYLIEMKKKQELLESDNATLKEDVKKLKTTLKR